MSGISDTTGRLYMEARLIPENMQELEAMIRRVVREEVSQFFENEQEQEDVAELSSPFIGQD
jgi:cytochrome P450